MDFKTAIQKAQPVPDDLPRHLALANWKQRRLPDEILPVFIQRVPRDRYLLTLGSGDLAFPTEYVLGRRAVRAVAGLSSFHFDAQDARRGFPINEYDFIVVDNVFRCDICSRFISFGPIKPAGNHWQTQIPEAYYQIPLLEIR